MPNNLLSDSYVESLLFGFEVFSSLLPELVVLNNRANGLYRGTKTHHLLIPITLQRFIQIIRCTIINRANATIEMSDNIKRVNNESPSQTTSL